MAFILCNSLPSRPIQFRTSKCSQRFQPPKFLIHSQIRNESNSLPNNFKLFKTVMPHDTDYSGSLWHGQYVTWFEEARIEYLNFINLPYHTLLTQCCIDLVVTELNMKYIAPIKLGEKARLTLRISVSNVNQLRLRIPLECEFIRVSDEKLCAVGKVVAVPISAETGKVARRLPPILIDSIAKSTVIPTAIELESSQL